MGGGLSLDHPNEEVRKALEAFANRRGRTKDNNLCGYHNCNATASERICEGCLAEGLRGCLAQSSSYITEEQRNGLFRFCSSHISMCRTCNRYFCPWHIKTGRGMMEYSKCFDGHRCETKCTVCNRGYYVYDVSHRSFCPPCTVRQYVKELAEATERRDREMRQQAQEKKEAEESKMQRIKNNVEKAGPRCSRCGFKVCCEYHHDRADFYPCSTCKGSGQTGYTESVIKPVGRRDNVTYLAEHVTSNYNTCQACKGKKGEHRYVCASERISYYCYSRYDH